MSSINNYIESKIKFNKTTKNTHNINELNESNNEDDDIELEKAKNYPKNYGNFWTDKERKIILKYLKKNIISEETYGSNLYDETIIHKIAKKTERSEFGVKEEIKKMIFNDYMWNLDFIFDTYEKLFDKYNIPEHNIKILIRIYLEKYGMKILYPIEIENKILKYQVENIKLKNELKELKELTKK